MASHTLPNCHLTADLTATSTLGRARRSSCRRVVQATLLSRHGPHEHCGQEHVRPRRLKGPERGAAPRSSLRLADRHHLLLLLRRRVINRSHESARNRVRGGNRLPHCGAAFLQDWELTRWMLGWRVRPSRRGVGGVCHPIGRRAGSAEGLGSPASGEGDRPSRCDVGDAEAEPT